jgi:hypothetical protein
MTRTGIIIIVLAIGGLYFYGIATSGTTPPAAPVPAAPAPAPAAPAVPAMPRADFWSRADDAIELCDQGQAEAELQACVERMLEAGR